MLLCLRPFESIESFFFSSCTSPLERAVCVQRVLDKLYEALEIVVVFAGVTSWYKAFQADSVS